MRSVDLSNVLITPKRLIKITGVTKAGLRPTNFAVKVTVKHVIYDAACTVYHCAQQRIEKDIFNDFVHRQCDTIRC